MGIPLASGVVPETRQVLSGQGLLADPASPKGEFFSSLSPLNREGNGTPLQYSCLENPMDGGAW